MPKCAHPEYINYINQAMDEGKIQTCYDRAAFLAQIAHESGQLNTFLETSTGQRYEGNKNLGNTEPGDGPKYRGRGALQITGRWNYGAAGKALKLDLLNNPDLVLEPEVAFRTSAWFWKTFKISTNGKLGTEDGFKAVTKRINNGMSHYDDRKKYWKKALQVLNCNGTKGEEEEESNYGTCEYEGQTGVCKNVDQCTDGFNIKNLCPKGSNVQCCIKNSVTTNPTESTESEQSAPSCTVNGDEGRCLSTTKDVCNGQFFTGYCKGLPKDIKCCVESEYGKCEHENTPGICRLKDTCTTGNLVRGKCPGNADIQCCLQRATSTAPTKLDGTCDSYETAETVQLQGSYSDKAKKTPGYYNVVKIQARHLTAPSWAKGTYDDHDIMIEPKAACAFVRMYNAAKKDNITLTITSGFRTFQRQEHLYKTLPAGQAAKPGGSNHGYGKALDLNADCKLKDQKKQNPNKKPCENHAVYQWLIKNAETYGFRRTVPHESWHFDYVE